MHSSVQEIRTRLLLLLVRAFVIVLLLSFFFFIAATGYFLASSALSPMNIQAATSLTGYYIGHGSWDGVETIFESNNILNSPELILLDKDHRILLNRRPDPVYAVGSTYSIQRSDTVVEITAHGEQVGSLVFAPYTVLQRLESVRPTLIPVVIVSFFLATFLVVVSILLVRRFVNPLADVIYAAREVASGNLNTRIPMKGPQDLRSLSESFNEMASSLERSDRERRELLADVAHELRTPLSVIRGRLEGIVDGIYPVQSDQISPALESVYLLERITDDLRLLTLAETRQLHFEKRDFDLGKLVKHIVNIFDAEAREKNISLSIDRGEGDLTVHADPQRTEQVISNLVGNALRYVPEGGKVWMKVTRENGSVLLHVNDNGTGIPEADLPYIFERFWRKDKSRSRASGGTGLGLAIAKQLIEAQGGTIEARNIPEGGLQVKIKFEKSSS